MDRNVNNIIWAYIRGLNSYYRDGTERLEIWINKKFENNFPNIFSQPVEIFIKFNNQIFTGFFRKTEKCVYLWFSPFLYAKEKRLRLADVLKKYKFKKNDKILISKINGIYEIKKGKK